MQSEISCRNPVKCNVKYTAGVCSPYLFVAGSIILLQCLSMIHKTGTNLRNDEIWRLLLLEQIPTLVNWRTRTLGRIIEKEIILPEICCRNVQFDIKLTDITHTCCSIVFAWCLNKAIRKKKRYSAWAWKMSIKCHVPSLPKWQKVLLIFRNISRSTTDENSFHVLLSKHFFSKHCTFTKIWSTFISFINFLLKFCNQK